jgi:hypothetical protein
VLLFDTGAGQIEVIVTSDNDEEESLGPKDPGVVGFVVLLGFRVELTLEIRMIATRRRRSIFLYEFFRIF